MYGKKTLESPPREEGGGREEGGRDLKRRKTIELINLAKLQVAEMKTQHKKINTSIVIYLNRN